MFQFKNMSGDEFKRILKFGMTGVMNTLIDNVVFTVLAQLLGVNAYLSKIVSYSAGTLNSYLVNRKWTFQSRSRFFSLQMVRFIITNLVTLAVSMLLIKLLIDYAGLIPALANLAATCITLVLNFLISRFWVFK